MTTTYLPHPTPGPKREFHVSRSARDTYEFSTEAFSLQGHILFADIRGARQFAMRINTVRRSVLHPDRAVRAGDVYAVGLIDEIFHYLIGRYLEQYGRETAVELERTLIERIGAEAVDRMLHTFAERYPTVAAYRGEESAQESLNRSVDGISGPIDGRKADGHPLAGKDSAGRIDGQTFNHQIG